MNQQKHRRRRLYLSNSSQPRILITMLALLGLVAVIMMVFLYLDYNMRLTERYPGFSNIQPVILSALVIINLVAAIFSLILIIIFTHRIAGPVYNLGRVLRGVAQGDLSETVKFRQRDFLHEVAGDGNLALDFIRKEIGEMKQLSEKLVIHLEESGETNAASDARELNKHLQKFTLEKDQEISSSS